MGNDSATQNISKTETPAKPKKARRGIIGRMKSKFSEGGENDKSLAVFIAVTALYGALLLIFFLLPNLLIKNDPHDPTGRAFYPSRFALELERTKAGVFFRELLFVSRYLFFAVLPTYFIYLFAHRPFGMKKGLATAFLVIGIVFSLIFAVLAVLLMNPNFRELLNLHRLGFSFQYFSTFGDRWLFLGSCFGELVIFMLIAYIGLFVGYLAWAKGLRPYWFVIVGVAFTLFAPVIGTIVLAAFILVFAVLFAVFIIKGFAEVAKTGVGGNGFFQSFKAGFYGTKIPYNYSAEVTNSSGCRETLYSDDCRSWYSANGEYKGESDDGGRTIILK